MYIYIFLINFITLQNQSFFASQISWYDREKILNLIENTLFLYTLRTTTPNTFFNL